MTAKNKKINLTKESTFLFFSKNKDDYTGFDYEFEGTPMTVSLKKGLVNGKKEYNFSVFINKEIVFVNETKKSRDKAIEELFGFIYSHPIYIEWKEKQRKTPIAITQDTLESGNFTQIDEFDLDEIKDTFSTLVTYTQEGLTEGLHDEKTMITQDELDGYLKRYCESPEKQKVLVEVSKRKKYLDEVEKIIAETGTIPQELHEYSSRNKAQASVVEKVLINRARALVVKAHIEQKVFDLDAIIEFKRRLFDFRIYRETSPYDGSHVSIDDNLFRHIEWCIKHNSNEAASLRGHSGYFVKDGETNTSIYVTVNKSTLEKKLGWDFQEIFDHVIVKLQESIYFYKKELGTLNSYITAAVGKVMNNLRNYTDRVDQDGRIVKYKDSWIRDVISRARVDMSKNSNNLNLKIYDSEEDRKAGKLSSKNQTISEQREEDPENVDDLMVYINQYNERTSDKNQKVSREEVIEMLPKLHITRYSFDDVLEGDEGEESQNNSLLKDLWDSEGQNTMFDPRYSLQQKETNEHLSRELNSICSNEAEHLVLEMILENIANNAKVGPKMFEIDLEEFNSIYTMNSNREPLSSYNISSIVSTLKQKIQNNPDKFLRYLDLDTPKTRTKKTENVVEDDFSDILSVNF